MGQLRLEVATVVVRLTRDDDAQRVSAAIIRAYGGEPVISIGLGRLDSVHPGPALHLARTASALAPRVELRSLRRPLRRALIASLADADDLVVHAAARRKLVLVAEARCTAHATAVLSPTRRKMLRLTTRDGEHCVWCSTPLTHSSAHATIDHVRCRSHGGADALDNLVLACDTCNNRRANRPATLWLDVCLQSGRAVDRAAVRAAIARSTRYHDDDLLRAA